MKVKALLGVVEVTEKEFPLNWVLKLSPLPPFIAKLLIPTIVVL